MKSITTTFCQAERRLLLAAPRIGPTVVERLEAAGFNSLDVLRRHGVEAAVEEVCQRQGHAAWRNRRSALILALNRVAQASPETSP